MPATFYIASLPFQDTPHSGGYMSAALKRTIAALARRTTTCLHIYALCSDRERALLPHIARQPEHDVPVPPLDAASVSDHAPPAGKSTRR